ncbi:MAG: DUF805 domain-containing protein [Rhizobiales bacterium]|nr:DUF805 domain-containing protein [Hyphomicrobiales bacterium]
MDGFIKKYFSIRGRMARLPYFTRGLQIAILIMLISLPCIPLFTSGYDILWWSGLLIVVVCGIIVIAATVSLVVRRLHDFGLSGYHAIWVVPFLFIQSEGRELYVAVPLIALSAWLTFWPGQKAPNRFGA